MWCNISYCKYSDQETGEFATVVESRLYFVMMISRRQLKKRLDVYHAQTKPLIDYYGDQGILKTVDGTQPMETVFEEIVKMLEA